MGVARQRMVRKILEPENDRCCDKMTGYNYKRPTERDVMSKMTQRAPTCWW